VNGDGMSKYDISLDYRGNKTIIEERICNWIMIRFIYCFLQIIMKQTIYCVAFSLAILPVLRCPPPIKMIIIRHDMMEMTNTNNTILIRFEINSALLRYCNVSWTCSDHSNSFVWILWTPEYR
jgi:hypothetical protein